MNAKHASISSVVLIVSACGGSSGDSSGGPEAEVSDVVNGYHLVDTTRFDEFDNIQSTWRRTTNYTQNTLDSTFTSFNDDGTVNIRSFSTTTYDSLGRLVQEDFTIDEVSDTTTYSFNEKGLLANSERDGNEAFTRNFVYDDTDRLISAQRIWFDGSTVDYTYTYDSQGLLTSALQEDDEITDPATDETIISSTSTSYVHDSNWRIIRRERISTRGFAGSETTEISDFSYDDNGNMVEQISTTADGVTRSVNTYEQSEEPIFNTWLRRFRYFP